MAECNLFLAFCWDGSPIGGFVDYPMGAVLLIVLMAGASLRTGGIGKKELTE